MKNTLVKTTRVAQQIGLRNPRPGEVGPQPIWLAQGGSEDNAGGDDTPDETDDEADKGDDGGDASTDDTKKPKTVSQADFERVKLHLSKADQKKAAAEARAAQLEAELNTLKTKDLPDAEKATLEHEKVVAERDAYKGSFHRLARTNAFLLASEAAKLNWVNSSAALKVGDLEDLEIEEDGTVPGMAEAIKQLAKDHPYLLAPKDSTDDTKDTPPKSGSAVGSKGKGKKTEEEVSDEDLRRRFPSLYR